MYMASLTLCPVFLLVQVQNAPRYAFIRRIENSHPFQHSHGYYYSLCVYFGVSAHLIHVVYLYGMLTKHIGRHSSNSILSYQASLKGYISHAGDP